MCVIAGECSGLYGVYSPFGARRPGIAHLRDLRFELMHCKSVCYDWIRTLPAARVPGAQP
jgi:hypothetical protein